MTENARKPLISHAAAVIARFFKRGRLDTRVTPVTNGCRRGR